MSNSNHVFVGLPALIKNAAASDPIVSAGDNHVSGIGFFDSIAGGTVNRDDLGINFRNTNFLAAVGTQVYFYTGAGVSDPDWTNGANWTELSNTHLTQALLDIQTNAGNIATNAGIISTAQSDISNNANSISTNASDITNNQNSISTNTTDIGQLQTDLTAETGARQTADSNLQSEIDAAELLISGNTSDITTNASGISSNAAAISAHVTSIDNHNDVDTSSTLPEIGQVLFWNGAEWIPEHPEVTVEVKNDTGASIAKGTPVYVSGTHANGKPLVDLADNDGVGTYPSIGLTYNAIAAGDEGLVVISGSIFGLNTIAYSAGDALYIDSTPGVLTSTRPTNYTEAVQKVALVKRSHASAGSVIVMGAGRVNDVPNLQPNYFWLGNGGVATPTNFDTEVSANTDVLANTTKLAGIDAGATANPNAIDNVVEDTTPQLGGGLDLNGQDITGSGNINITGKVTQTATPTANQDLATKVYVDELIAAGIHYHNPVRVESPDSEGSLNGTYNNGTAGVGATLTNAGTQAALVIDGVTLAVSDRVLIYNQTDATENGIYTVTNTGSPTTNWVLTRATDADSYGLGNTELSEGTSVFVLEGDDGAGEVYGCTTTGTITFGTTDIDFSQIGASPVYGNATQTEDGFMSSGDKTKLDNIAAGATANQTDAYLRDRANHTGTQTASTISNFDAAVSANSDVSANVTKLAGIEAGATADQTAGEIKTAYESNSNTNAFTDADVTKLGSIATGAEVNVNADWNETNSALDAFILNKPTLSSVATGGASTDLTDSADLIRDTDTISALQFQTQPTVGQYPFLGGTGWIGQTPFTSTTFSPTTGSNVVVNASGSTVALTSSDSSVTITGSTSTLDFKATGSSGGPKRTLTVPTTNDYAGDVVTFGSAPSGGFTVGKLYYFANTGAWEEAYGTSTTTSIGMLGICVNTTTPELLVRGIIRNSSYANQFSLSRRLYVSTLQGGSGRFMDSVPGSPPTGAVIRAAGFVTDSVNGVFMFDPSQDYITVT